MDSKLMVKLMLQAGLLQPCLGQPLLVPTVQMEILPEPWSEASPFLLSFTGFMV